MVLEGSAALYPGGYDFSVPGKEGHLDRATEQRLIDELLSSGKRLAL